ncbi:hypothetical protein [Acinetobacter lactucae]|uniref:hypothetical protein n=1 Tax=Acinetobacter lactucae TaxID=1785128 RepID=UPI001D186D36|nr:hypothetical protein [Acinetobacter lactucae]
MSSVHEFEINHLAEANHQWRMKYLNLQKRVDLAHDALRELKEKSEALHHRWNILSDSVALAEAEMIDMCVSELAQALKSIEGPNHNTSCTYQFELAFHNLQDTPELRKIYWSALGQLQFDSNDQVIPPELEECPCCKPLIRKIGTETDGYETFEVGIDESGNRYIRHPHCAWEPEE